MQLTETYRDLPVEPGTAYRTIVQNNPVKFKDPFGLWMDNKCIKDCYEKYKRFCKEACSDVCKPKNLTGPIGQGVCAICIEGARNELQRCWAEDCQYFGPHPPWFEID